MQSQAAATRSIDSVCRTRADLLDRLAVAVEQLGRAKLNLRERLEDKSSIPGSFVAREVEQLRADCGLIRAELEYHRSSHGC